MWRSPLASKRKRYVLESPMREHPEKEDFSSVMSMDIHSHVSLELGEYEATLITTKEVHPGTPEE